MRTSHEVLRECEERIENYAATLRATGLTNPSDQRAYAGLQTCRILLESAQGNPKPHSTEITTLVSEILGSQAGFLFVPFL